MADEFKDENAEESEELEHQESLEGQGEAADEEALADAVVEQPEEEVSEYEKSASEILAEQAMLAELEASASEGDEEEEEFPSNDDDNALAENPKNLELLLDVSLNVTVELGRKEMRFGEVLNLGKGSLVELNKIADEPVDIYVNQSKIAEGEVVVVDDHFGVRITRLVSTEKMKSFS